MGVSDKITSIAIPLGATVNMDAVSIVLSFMIVFFANACGVEVSTSMMIVILLANVILSVGTPGIPGGAIASFAALATMAGLPAGVMGVYISINTLCDMGATCVNVIGDMAGCVVLKEKITSYIWAGSDEKQLPAFLLPALLSAEKDAKIKQLKNHTGRGAHKNARWTIK